MKDWYEQFMADGGSAPINGDIAKLRAKRRGGQGVIAKLIGDSGSYGVDSKKRV